VAVVAGASLPYFGGSAAQAVPAVSAAIAPAMSVLRNFMVIDISLNLSNG
jgi:hypothetical protein